MFKRVLIGVVFIVLAAIAYIYSTYGSIARAGSGYAAKNICSGYFLSGFSPEIMRDQALRGASSTLASVSYDLNVEDRRVRTKLYGLFERHAVYTPGVGCTLLPAGEKDAEISLSPLPELGLPADEAWPMGQAATDLDPDVVAMLEDAFIEESAEAPRYTKAIVV
ncbi:MAG: hypothetical protein AAFQ15_13125, partial [Pseudomonadota bacterium]